MEQKTKQKMSTKKKASAVVAGVLVAALALGGAYAWTDYSQNARNTFKGNVAADVLLHDDFNGENKDVYVENTGDSNVYVRVKFAEYLQIGNNSVLTAYSDSEEGTTKKADPDDVTTWPVHQFTTATVANVCNGDAKDAHNYYEWNMSGAQKAYLAGVTEADSDGMGGLSQEEFEKLDIGVDFALGTIVTHKNKTQREQAVMLLSDYLALDTANRPTNGCWLLDTDGWCYWSKALKPDTATNLLLDEVLLKDTATPYDNWLYHIDVQLQAASANEMDYWYRDGSEVAVADPDNSVATTTANGYAFINEVAGAYFTGSETDGLVIGADDNLYVSLNSNNVYKLATLSDDGTYVATGDPIVAGIDKIPGNEDDNVLAGRTVEGGQSIAIDPATIDVDAGTYKLKDATAVADLVVTSGVDKLLGTYDDVLTSPGGSLGIYPIETTTSQDNVGWIYLGGPVTNMLVATEYVLDNVQFSSDSKAYEYAGSDLQTKIVEIGGKMNISAKVNSVELKMSADQHTGQQVYVCTKGCEEGQHSGCTYGYSSYYTNTAEQLNIADTKFFALSLKEVIDAYGDGTGGAIGGLRIAQAAPAYVHPTPGKGGDGYNRNYSASWRDGDGNLITTTSYWLRSPGYRAGRAAYIVHTGNANATDYVTAPYVGARPACYLDLTSSN